MERNGGDPGAWRIFCEGPCRLGSRMLSPRARGPSVPTRIPPISAESQGSAQCDPLEAEALKPTLPLTPQVHISGRCAPDNQRHGPFPDPTQTTRCHQAVGPQRLQSFSSAWKVGSSFLCTLCFIFMYLILFYKLPYFNFYVCTLYVSYF